MATLFLSLLGTLDIALGKQPVSDFKSDKVRALLAYLAVEADRPHRREALAALLWPEMRDRSARSNLRDALANLRQAIGDRARAEGRAATPPILLIERNTIQFNASSDAWLDVARFCELREADRGDQPAHQQLAEAVELYRGGFLEGFSLKDSPAFDDWSLLTRERLQRQALLALSRLVNYYEGQGAYGQACDYARRQLELEPWDEEAVRHLMRLLALDGQRGAALLQYESCRQSLAEELGVEPAEETTRLFEQIRDGTLAYPGVVPTTEAKPGREPRPVGDCPYRGLAAFRERDAPFFFGREDFALKLHQAVQQHPVVTVIVGSSGSGKSSVVAAGLLPRLREDGDWLIAPFRPGRRPFSALASALLTHLEGELSETDRLLEVEKLAQALYDGDLELQQVVGRISEKEDGEKRLLLAGDQFEELYTLCPDPGTRRRFVDSLLAAAASGAAEPVPPVVILLSLRADFMGQALSHRPFADTLQDTSLLLGPMTQEEMQAAIEMPAQKQGAAFEAGLVNRILDDVGDEPGNLPLLEFALMLLWERADAGWLTHEAYDAIGRVDGALARYADEVYAALDEAQQDAARRVFLQLIRPGQGTEDSRRVATQAEIGEQNWPLTQHLADRRLVVTGLDSAGFQTVEVVHEALIGGWARLRAWMEADRAFRTWQEGLRAAQRQWELSNYDDGALLRGTPLAQAEGWLVERGTELSPDETEFIGASVALRESRQARRERRRRWTVLALAGGLVIAVVLAVVAVLAFQQATRSADSAQAEALSRATAEAVAVWEGATAEAASTLAVGERAAAETAQAEEAAQRAVAQAEAEARATQQAVAETEAQARATQQAVAEQKEREALEAYSQSLAAHANNALESGDTAAGLALALAANDMDQPPELSQRILRQAAYAPGPCRQYQVAELFPDVEGRIYSLAMSPVAQEALIGFEDGSLILWDVAAESEIHRLEGHAGTVRAVAFSPDGQTALSGSSDRLVILWDLETGQEIRRFEGHDGWVRTVAFSPDGGTAVSGGFTGDSVVAAVDPGELILWNLKTGEEVRRFEGHPSGVVAAAFSPNGRTVLASSGFFANVPMGFSLILWDVETGEAVHSFEVEHDNFSLAIRADGAMALTGANDQNVYLWDLETGERVRTLEGHQGVLTTVAFTPDGRRAISGDWNGRLILWDLTTGEQAISAKAHQAEEAWAVGDPPPMNVAPDPQGRTLLTSAGDGTLILWDLFNAGEIRRFEGHSTAVWAVAYTPDGEYALTGAGYLSGYGPVAEDNSLRLWDIDTGELIRVFEGHTGPVSQVTISADGHRALSASLDSSMRLWDLESGDEVRIFEGYAEGVGVFSVAFSPDGRTALSGPYASGNPIILWDLESGEIIHSIDLDDDDPSTTLFFNPDGRTAYGSQGLVLYDLETGQEIRRYSADCCTGFAIHPDGRTAFVVGNVDRILREWDLETDREIRVFGEHKGFRTRVALNPDGRTVLSSGWDGTLFLWDLETGNEIRRFASYDNGFILDIAISPDGRTALVPGSNGAAILWRLDLPSSLDELGAWLADNRYIRDLTCEEREAYQITPLCED